MKHLSIGLFIALIATACGGNRAFDRFIEPNKDFPIAIVNGTIIDGTGKEPYQSDLLIHDDRIVYIGKVDLDKINVESIIDAQDKFITPGFIDVHTHGNPIRGTSFENFLAAGVTTIVLGQDGSNPFLSNPEQRWHVVPWMDSLERIDLELNIAMLVGHGALRRLSKISDQGTPTNDQIETMVGNLSRALDSGCYGISTGLEYVPGMYATKPELQALAKVVGKADGVMMSHMRNEDDDAIEASIQELLELGSYCKVHASHLKVVYGKGADRGKEILKILEEARDNGIEVSADVYPYIASYTGIGILFPMWSKTQSQFKEVVKTRKAELEDYLLKRVLKRNGPEATLFGTGKYAGKRLSEVAEEEGKSYVDVLMDVNPQGASGAYFIMDQELQDVFITHPEIMIASDGSPTMLHPRGHGSQARIIERYVNEQKVLNLSQAIYKMSGLPAKTMGLEERGTIKVYNHADILVFNPSRIKENATFTDPYQFSEGFEYVILNGKLTRQNNELLLSDAGRLLRKNQ